MLEVHGLHLGLLDGALDGLRLLKLEAGERGRLGSI
jgi:hypothetical protein